MSGCIGVRRWEIGDVIGMLRVVGFQPHQRGSGGSSGRARYVLQCECGTVVVCRGSNLGSGATRSCGRHGATRVPRERAGFEARRSAATAMQAAGVTLAEIARLLGYSHGQSAWRAINGRRRPAA